MTQMQDEDTLLTMLSARPASASRTWALRVLSGPTAGTLFDARTELTIGRGAGVTIRCVDPTVSRVHAAIRLKGEQLIVEDLGSRNGTSVAGRLVLGPTELHEGDRVDCGSLSFRVVRADDREMKESKRLYDAATYDPVTGVFNRSYFDMSLGCALEQARNDKRPVALLLVDADHFKDVNDRYGHLTGDAVLRCLGSEITSMVRLHDTVARWGGEEFVVLLPRTSLLEAALIADRIRSRVEQCDMGHLGMDRGVTVSIGVADSEPGARLPAALLACADAAAYRAKAAGRNRVYVFSEEEMGVDAWLLRGSDGHSVKEPGHTLTARCPSAARREREDITVVTGRPSAER